jgi:hypothetical protein
MRNSLLANISTQSWDDETQTFVGVLATTKPVRLANGTYEVIDVDAIDTKQLIGKPLLDSHRRESIDDQKGVIVAARHEPGKLIIQAHVEDPRVAARIRRGTLRALSIGYVRDSVVSERVDPKTRARIQTVRVTPLEASLVVIPADETALIRKEPKMRKKQKVAVKPAPKVEIDEDVIDTPQPETESTVAETRAEIRSIAKRAGLSAEWADAQIDADATPDEARAAAFEETNTRGRNVPGVRVLNPGQSPEQRNELRAAGFAARYLGVPLPEEIAAQAREFANMSGLDHARDIAEANGIRVRGMPAERVFLASMQVRSGMNTQSDFALMMDSGFSTAVRAAHEAATSPIVPTATIKRTATNFKTNYIHQLGEFSALQKTRETEEIPHISRGEARESWALDTYAGRFAASRQLILGDEFNQLGDFARDAGQAAAATVANLVVAEFTKNGGAGPVFSDGVALFHADHGNYDPVAADISIGSVADARKAMLLQTGQDGVTIINVKPDTIIVAPSNLTEAERITAAVTPASHLDINPFSQRLNVVVEPRLEAIDRWRWYLADSKLPALVLGGLAGAEGPQVSARDGWEILGREWRVYIDVGVGPYDWRGVYRHEGAPLDSNSSVL